VTISSESTGRRSDQTAASNKRSFAISPARAAPDSKGLSTSILGFWIRLVVGWFSLLGVMGRPSYLDKRFRCWGRGGWGLVLAILSVWSAVGRAAQDDAPQIERRAGMEPGQQWAARDTLAAWSDDSTDAQRCLQDLLWQPTTFTVTVESPPRGQGVWLLRFPSPHPQGDPAVDSAALEWHPARDDQGQIVVAPAVVVIHESGRGMTVGRLIARGLAALGVHGFLLQLPGYGQRGASLADDPQAFLAAMKQSVGDARRARDAVAALPQVEADSIGLQGTSLGGFVAATASGLDHGYDQVFILLAGGNLHEVVLHGARDAAKVRQRLQEAGLDDSQILQLTRPVEPLRLAHRVAADRAWLYSGIHDDVVPPSSSDAWADAVKLKPEHHIRLPADHYSGIVHLPKVLGQIVQKMQTLQPREPSPGPDNRP